MGFTTFKIELQNYFKNGRVFVWKETFAIVKLKKNCPNAFANIVNKKEITVIIEESRVNKDDALEIERGRKILTFDMVLPFGLVGILSKISQALADEKIPNCYFSLFDRSHSCERKGFGKGCQEIRKFGFAVL